MTNIDEIIEKDTSVEFIEMMKIFSDSSFKPEFVDHMVNAMIMSHFKYGWVKDKSASHYSCVAGFERAAYERDQNDEHLVNIANFAMMCYMVDEPRQDYVDIAVDCMDRFSEARYQATDSDKSVQHRVKPSRVTDQLRKLVEDSPYDMFPPIDPSDHFIW